MALVISAVCSSVGRHIPPSVCVCAVNYHRSSLSLSACMRSCVTSVCTCLVVTGQQTWKLGQRQSEGREGKRFRHPLNMRVNHNWFAIVTVELLDRCLQGVCGVGAVHWERGLMERRRRRRRRNLGCVSSCVYQQSLMRSFSLRLSPAWSSAVFEVWAFIERTSAQTCTYTSPIIHRDSNLEWSIVILFVVSQCDPSWSPFYPVPQLWLNLVQCVHAYLCVWKNKRTQKGGSKWWWG